LLDIDPCPRSSRLTPREEGPFLRDEFAMPAQERRGGDDGVEVIQGLSADFLGQRGEGSALGVREQDATSPKLRAQSAILGLQVLDSSGGMPFEPAGHAGRMEGEERSRPKRHRAMLSIARGHWQFEFWNITRKILDSGN